MAIGIRKLHSKGCPGRDGGRCNCGAGWEAAVYLAREDRKVRKTFRSVAEARSWRADALAAANRGALSVARRETRTLATAMREFVNGMQSRAIRPRGRSRYKPNTVRSYRRAVANYIESAPISRLKVAEVRRSDVQALADTLLAEGLSPGSVSNVLNPIQALYRRLIDRDQISYNPATRIDLPAQRNARPTRIASVAEAAQLLSILPDRDRPVWAAAFYAGLRRGELQALRVCDIDLGASLIRVERGWDQEEGPIEPKSAASRRTVPILASLRDHLDEHLLRVEREGEQLVFGRTAVDPFVASTIDNRAKRAWRQAGLIGLTLHECRHTFASLLIDSGANAKAVQECMGHGSITVTFDTYGHLLPGAHDQVRERMDDYLLDVTAEAAGAVEDAP